jgi:hypothetical protein
MLRDLEKSRAEIDAAIDALASQSSARYNALAVDKAIASSSRHGPKIGKREAGAIHRLLKGRHGNPAARCTVGGAVKSAAKRHGKRIAKKAAHGALNLVQRGIDAARRKVNPSKNPAGKIGYAIYARKGNGPKLHFDGVKFTNNSRAKLYWDLSEAEATARGLVARYAILRSYAVSVEDRRPK